MFFPLETMFGWPAGPELSAGFYIMLLFVLPMAFGLVISLLAWAPTFAKRFRQQTSESTELTTQ